MWFLEKISSHFTKQHPKNSENKTTNIFPPQEAFNEIIELDPRATPNLEIPEKIKTGQPKAQTSLQNTSINKNYKSALDRSGIAGNNQSDQSRTELVK